MEKSPLGALGGPAFLVTSTGRTTFAAVRYGRPGTVVRKVRGWKCRDVPGLMSEFGAAFQIFEAFGENWHALEESLCYLDEWLPAEGYVLVVERAEQLLCDTPEELRSFVAVMTDVARWWAKPVVNNTRFNRPPRPFQVVLEIGGDAELIRRFEQAGAVFSELSG